MSTPLRVLIIENSEDDAALLLRELRRGGYDPTCERVDTAEAMKAALTKQTWDIVISDYVMPHFSAPAALTLFQDSGLDLPFIIVSGSIGEDIAVSAMKAGAHDYIMKGNLARLNPAIERELREAEGRRERRRAEAALRQSEEWIRQAQKMEAIGRLAGGIAHDFNNLLTIIMGYSELLLSGLTPVDPLRRNAEGIKKAADRATDLTRQLLAFSRRQMLAPVVLSLNGVIDNVAPILQRLIGEDITLVTVCDPTLRHVKADPGQVEQVIMNLAVNARDAMPQGGKLTIETANVELDKGTGRRREDLRPGRYALLAVRDTGCGIDAETRSHLFEPFFTTKEPGKGTGLGLSTVYGIVQQNSGYIEVDSEPERGATFKIYLPHVGAANEVLEPGTTHIRPPGGAETVLLVEDEAGIRELVREMLQRTGYTVLEAANGLEALELCERHRGPVHLLLTDVRMPGISGPEVAQRLAPLHPDMKVLYMSGYTGDALADQDMVGLGTALLEKPFLPDALVRKVREVLDANRTRK
ncbi:MAG: response regulator [Nitrospinae bacterium]|nr:response regulator [Nitrospinota bacterium]